LLKHIPQHILSVQHDKKHKSYISDKESLGIEIELEDLKNIPLINFPLDSSQPDTHFTVVAFDVDSDHPELLNPPSHHHHKDEPSYHTTSLVHISTPTTQRMIWLTINVPSPQMIKNGHQLTRWDADIENLKEKKELHRIVFLVYKQSSIISTRKLLEDSLSENCNRLLSLPKFISSHSEIINNGAWAGNFFMVDCLADQVFKDNKHIEEMMKPIRDLKFLPHEIHHPRSLSEHRRDTNKNREIQEEEGQADIETKRAAVMMDF